MVGFYYSSNVACDEFTSLRFNQVIWIHEGRQLNVFQQSTVDNIVEKKLTDELCVWAVLESDDLVTLTMPLVGNLYL